MVTRQFDGVLWDAKSPSVYFLVGYPTIKAYFNGKSWHVIGSDMKYSSILEISEIINDACETFNTELIQQNNN